MRKVLTVLVIIAMVAVIAFVLLRHAGDKPLSEGRVENAVSKFQPLISTVPIERKSVENSANNRQEEDELTFEEFNALLDMCLKDEEEETQQKESSEKQKSKKPLSYQPEDEETRLETQDEQDEMLIAFEKARKAYMAIEAQLAPLQRESFKINRRMEEIILHDMKEARTREEIDALKEEFNSLKRRHNEISPIIDELIAEQKRVREEFEMEYGISFSEAYLLYKAKWEEETPQAKSNE